MPTLRISPDTTPTTDSSDASSPGPVQTFIARWSASGGYERAAAQLFLTELCDLLGQL